MKSLQTARAVVIDDNKDEAAAMLRALGTLGIGALYFTGEEEQLPEHPIEGIRIVFLDLRLFGALSGEPQHYIAVTLSVMRRVIPARAGVTGVVCWTKHEEDIEELKRQLYTDKTIPEFSPSFLLVLESKIDLVAEPDALLAKIQHELADLHAHRLLWDWEQAVHDAATGTTDLLLDLAAPEPNSGVLALLGALVVASAGKTVRDERTAIGHLFAGLNPVHYDCLEQLARSRTDAGGHVKAVVSEAAKPISLNISQKGRLNACHGAG